MNYHDKLMEFLCENFMIEEDEFELDISLVDQGVIDSFGLIEIAAYIEEETGVKVEEHQITRENFGSFHKIIAFMLSLKST